MPPLSFRWPGAGATLFSRPPPAAAGHGDDGSHLRLPVLNVRRGAGRGGERLSGWA